MSESLQSYLDFATETAHLAGRLTLGYFQAGVRPDLKPDDSPVTIADRQAEELIRARIEKTYPSHAIVGEEFGAKETAGASHRWFVDPIDGTKSFIRGVPLYGVLLGLEIEGTVEVGAAYFPALDDMVYAASGLGCWWNGRRRACPTSAAWIERTSRAATSAVSPGTAARRPSSASSARPITAPAGAMPMATAWSPPAAPNSCSTRRCTPGTAARSRRS